MSEATLIDYYGRRAHEYERIYQKPERRADLALLREHLRAVLTGRRVLELACGTGYWTAAIADVVDSILATDASEAVLAIAHSKGLDPARVSFRLADAYNPLRQSHIFTAGFAAFWWSHIPRARLTPFLNRFHAALVPGARVVFADNRFVPGSSTPICRTDAAGNTYQQRHLQDGTTHEVLKNFPSLRSFGPSFSRIRTLSRLPRLITSGARAMTPMRPNRAMGRTVDSSGQITRPRLTEEAR